MRTFFLLLFNSEQAAVSLKGEDSRAAYQRTLWLFAVLGVLRYVLFITPEEENRLFVVNLGFTILHVFLMLWFALVLGFSLSVLANWLGAKQHREYVIPLLGYAFVPIVLFNVIAVLEHYISQLNELIPHHVLAMLSYIAWLLALWILLVGVKRLFNFSYARSVFLPLSLVLIKCATIVLFLWL